jgi:hypothetical protein
MKYFETLPSIITSDYNNNLIVLKNLMSRAVLMAQTQSDALMLYNYSVQDGDTPETVAYKYYGSVDRYWIVLHGNQSLDPQWDWPLTSQQFQKYIIGKYKQATANSLNIPVNTVNDSQVLSYTTATVKYLEKIIIIKDNTTQTKSAKTIKVNLLNYNAITPSEKIINFPDGSSATRSITKRIISVYNYENNLNESKRNIRLINASYVGSLELQLQSLMSK